MDGAARHAYVGGYRAKGWTAMTNFKGAMTALVTPMRDGEVDVAALRELVEWQIEEGIDGLVPCGTTGESATLTPAEQLAVIRTVAEQTRRRVPVVAGAGTASTRVTVELSRAAREAGADGLLWVCPYYNRPNQAGLEAHFRTAAQAASMPVVVYNVPARTGSDLQNETLGALKNVSEICAIKDASGNILRAQRLIVEHGERFAVLCGDDALTVGMMAVGAVGVISVTSNVAPGPMAKMVQACAEDDFAQARRLQAELLPLHEALFCEPNPMPAKAALVQLGKVQPEIRLPMVWASEAAQQRVSRALEKAGALR